MHSAVAGGRRCGFERLPATAECRVIDNLTKVFSMLYTLLERMICPCFQGKLVYLSIIISFSYKLCIKRRC